MKDINFKQSEDALFLEEEHIILKDQIKKFNSILMKIDVQGFDLEVLKGSKHVLKHINYLYIEASSVELYKNQPLLENIKDFLFEEGFFLEGSFNQSYGKNKKLIHF